MSRRLGTVDLSHDQLLEAVTLLNRIEHATADIARDRPELDEFVGDVRVWLREVRALFRTPSSVSQAQVLRRLLEEVEAIDRRLAVH
ncbi:MAG: hypothetical protein R2745_13490 [Vicinamibacterales bacterium]